MHHASYEIRLARFALILFFFVVAGYAVFELRGLLFGPSITISQTRLETDTQYVEVRGTATRIADLKMNGASIPVTESGAFDQPYLLLPGYNRIVLDASDKYGKTAQRTLEIIYTPTASSTALTAPATSTAATSTPGTARATATTSAEVAR